MSHLHRTGPANQLGFDVQVLGMEPVMRPITAALGASLACAAASGLFVLDTQVYRFAPVPLFFFTLALICGGLRHVRQVPPLPDPDRIQRARAALGVFGTDHLTLDLDLDRDPWLRLEAEHGRVELTNEQVRLDPPDPDLQQRLETALASPPARLPE